MIWSDSSFPYHQYKGIKFETIAIDEGDDKIIHQVDYCKELNLYRVTHFLNGHWNGDVVFQEVDKIEKLS